MNRLVKVVFHPASGANFVRFFEDLNNLIIFERIQKHGLTES